MFEFVTDIPKTELVVYILLWSHGVCYSCYCVYLFAKDNIRFLAPQDFQPGWSFLVGPKDVSDFEWTVCSSLLVKLIPWFLAHVVVCNLLRKFTPKFWPWPASLLSFLCVVRFIGTSAAIFILSQTLILAVVSRSKSKLLCWTASLSFLAFLNLRRTGWLLQDALTSGNSAEEYLLEVTVAWANARCLSFALIRCETGPKVVGADLTVLVFYAFYLPVFFTGPFLVFDVFESEFNATAPKCTFARASRAVGNIARYAFWMLFNDWLLHWFYFSALNFQPHLVSRLALWPLCGLGFATSQFFMTKYVVLYGVPRVLAEAEGFQGPPHPKCIARIHLYSDMWRHFDRGLYTFLKRFIYVPTVVRLMNFPPMARKLSAGGLCFAFVWMWHGGSHSAAIWALLNYAGIVLESLGREFCTTRFYRNITEKWLSRAAVVRIHAAAAAPLLMMSAISNFFFLCGTPVGSTFVNRILWQESWSAVTVILLYLYCFGHVSIAVKSWESKGSREPGMPSKAK